MPRPIPSPRAHADAIKRRQYEAALASGRPDPNTLSLAEQAAVNDIMASGASGRDALAAVLARRKQP